MNGSGTGFDAVLTEEPGARIGLRIREILLQSNTKA
jgi:hypothetical protein